MRSSQAWLHLAACALALAGCSHSTPRNTPVSPLPATPIPAHTSIRFESVAKTAGVHFSLSNHGKSPLTILQTAGGGCAFLDYDSDGWADILLVGPYNFGLYHNEHNGTFRDVTSTCGIDKNRCWMGCAVGDYDGDGRPDLFLTGYHCFALYHNLGNGRFQDVTVESGISGLEWSMSAAFADLSGSGKLDLCVSQYVHFDKGSPQTCAVGTVQSACGPEVYSALSGKLFHNLDGRHFKPVPWIDTGKTWGVLASDILDTGTPQLYLANDMMPGDLWQRRGGRWTNEGAASGTAFDGQGGLQGGMGVDSGDYDNDGKLDLLVTTYFQQQASLYHNDGNGFFTAASGQTLLGPPTVPYVKFGAGFCDMDNDGWLDILMTSGHVRDNIHAIDASQTYEQPTQLFRNDHGRFAEVTATCGLGPIRAVGRGLAFADYDHDGKMDALICNLDGEAILLHNITQNGNHWLDVRLKSTGMNRFGLGARVTATQGGTTQIREVRTSGSVLSSSDPTAHFGLGMHSSPVDVSVRWPGGRSQKIHVDRTDTIVNIQEPK